MESDQTRWSPHEEFGRTAFLVSVTALLLSWIALLAGQISGRITGHTALAAGSLALTLTGFGAYMWATREERREFAQRMAQAERIRRSLQRGRLPR